MTSLACFRHGLYAYFIKRAAGSSPYRFYPLVERRWRASVPASPPAEPDAPEFPGKPTKNPDAPQTPDLPPDDVPPEIDDPQPDGVPEPVREPPVMPTPTASIQEIER